MTLTKFLFILVSCSALLSCNLSVDDKENFDWETFDSNLKDSILFMKSSGYIPNSVEGADSHEPEGFSKLMWIQRTLTMPQAELLLYKFSDGVVKGIAISTLIRKKNPDLFTNFLYALNSDINVSYYMFCEKLGGYALSEINYNTPGNLERFFNDTNEKRIRELIEEKSFDCN